MRIAIAGLGKIARDQHLPAIAADPAFLLAATADPDPRAGAAGVPHFESLEAMLADGPPVDAVAICTPPQSRHRIADAALARGLHVLLEKPPAATLSETAALEARAAASGATLFAAWHSRFAAGVAPARDWLAGRRVLAASIEWREDVRVWHPGQDWIFAAGGLGVFDPGINALSIATHILPGAIHLATAELDIPENREAPVAARLAMRHDGGAAITVELDFLQTGPQTWDIAVETDGGRLLLQRGGAALTLPEGSREGEDREYAGVYARFAELIRGGASEVDIAPLRLVADAFLRGTMRRAAPFTG
ncbi:Gfo/Idh/MocA family protein [Sphingomonas canadensis]|uniref:Gfo/Idh/MocA family protein n=1 Tax=Sphingomonas canadensis TaxID=1219257 RepID=A0ABW3H1N9_9SPHN|nr:Gfo/Idh/MocA family oxidoreductase [Sphingomonas canadensis]